MHSSNMGPATHERVARHTDADVNAQIRQEAVWRVRSYEGAAAERIDARIEELRREWDIERVLEANAAGIALLGVTLGASVDRRWYALPAIVAGFLLQHAVQGWCPPLPLFRRLGVRTAQEIHEEIVALKALRGDFGPDARGASAALRNASLH